MSICKHNIFFWVFQFSPNVLLQSKYLHKTKLRFSRSHKNRALCGKVVLVWKLGPAISSWASGSSKLTRQTCSGDSIKSHQYRVISPLLHTWFGICHKCSTKFDEECSQCMSCRAFLGFTTTLPNRPCRVSWVRRLQLIVNKFDFHVTLAKMHDIYNYRNPNPEMSTKNGLEIKACKDDFAWRTVQRCDFVDMKHGLYFLLKTKRNNLL